ncbi:hypothetical protein BgiBS90_027219 [Biomphalaria glabrata]|nr:hypothetical protein BgiBS90_027219 [Biomphalaria glabrata]
MTICVFVPVFCKPSQCTLTTSNRFIKSGLLPSLSKTDNRDIVEYFVTYINDNDERVTFDRTNTTNSTRFQPMRWFNINEKIVYILPMMYDYYFSITRYFMNIQTIHIDLNVTPEDCIYSIDYEEVEILTRKFFIDSEKKRGRVKLKDTDGGFSFKNTDGGFSSKNTDGGFSSNVTDGGLSFKITDGGFSFNVTICVFRFKVTDAGFSFVVTNGAYSFNDTAGEFSFTDTNFAYSFNDTAGKFSFKVTNGAYSFNDTDGEFSF